MNNNMIELIKLKKNKETGEIERDKLLLDKKDIICLYKDGKNCYVLTKNGYLHIVDDTMKELKKYTGL